MGESVINGECSENKKSGLHSVHNWFILISYLYLALPFCIFVIGWCKVYIALPITMICLFCVVKASFIDNQIDKMAVTADKHLARLLAFIFFIIFIWVVLSGVGRLVYQNSDHWWRNAIYEGLVNNKWPVVKTFQSETGDSTRGLIYYIGFWIPSAVVGKIFGVEQGYMFQTWWAAIGIFLFYMMVCLVRKKIDIWPLLIFIGFSGLDIVGKWVMSGYSLPFESIFSEEHIEWWTGVQFSAMTTQLFWVFNQAIPAWIIVAMMYLQKSNRYIVFLLGISLFFSSLPFMGMMPLAAYFCFAREYEGLKHFSKQWWMMFLKDTFSLENVIGGGVVGIFSFLYLCGNESGQAFGINMFASIADFKNYILFILIEAGVYFIVIFKYQKKNTLYWFLLLVLLACPLIRVGYASDFCMRASIPAIVLLYILVCQSLEKSFKEKDRIIFGVITAVCLIGFVTPLHEIKRTVNQTSRDCIWADSGNQANVTEDTIINVI